MKTSELGLDALNSERWDIQKGTQIAVLGKCATLQGKCVELSLRRPRQLFAQDQCWHAV